MNQGRTYCAATEHDDYKQAARTTRTCASVYNHFDRLKKWIYARPTGFPPCALHWMTFINSGIREGRCCANKSFVWPWPKWRRNPTCAKPCPFTTYPSSWHCSNTRSFIIYNFRFLNLRPHSLHSWRDTWIAFHWVGKDVQPWVPDLQIWDIELK